jgi:hypothetical protein
MSPVFNLNQKCELLLYIRTNCVDTIRFDRLSVRFNLAHYNSHCVIDTAEQLTFEPNKTRQFKFSFLLHKDDMNKELEISSVSLELGSKEKRVLIINWKGDCKNGLAAEDFTIASFSNTTAMSMKAHAGDKELRERLEWDSIKILPITRFEK